MLENGSDSGSGESIVPCVLVCQHQSCLRNGSHEVLMAFLGQEIPNYQVQGVGCQGQCSVGPTVRILPEEVWYFRVKSQDVALIIDQHLKGGIPVENFLNPRIHIRY